MNDHINHERILNNNSENNLTNTNMNTNNNKNSKRMIITKTCPQHRRVRGDGSQECRHQSRVE